MELPFAPSGLEIISRQECLQLLRGQRVGRVAFVARDQPMVLPVNYAIHGGTIVLRTGTGTKLEAMRSSKVAFEVDEFDVVDASGWSVVVQGVAEDITDADDLTAGLLRDSAVPSWAPGDLDHYVRIDPTMISGRRIPVSRSGH